MTFIEWGKPNWSAGARALFLAALTMAPAASSQPDGIAVDLHKGYPFVKVTINNQQFYLLFDTGTTAIVLKKDAAVRAGVKAQQRELLASTSGEEVVPASFGNTVRIGRHTIDNVEILIHDLPILDGIHGKADGIVGFSMLSQHRVLLNLRKKHLLLGDEAAAEGHRLPNKLPAILRDGRVVLRVGVGSGEPTDYLTDFTLDTGAPWMILPRMSRATRLLERNIQLQTVHGFQSATRVAIHKIQFGDAVVFDMEAFVLAPIPSVGEHAGVIPTNWFDVIYFEAGFVHFVLKGKS